MDQLQKLERHLIYQRWFCAVNGATGYALLTLINFASAFACHYMYQQAGKRLKLVRSSMTWKNTPQA